MRYLSVLLVILFFSCQPKNNNKTETKTKLENEKVVEIIAKSVTVDEKDSSKVVQNNIIAERENIINEINVDDSLVFNSVKLNKEIPLMPTESELTSKLGAPDSLVIEYGWDCGNYIDSKDSVTVYYYGKTRFIASGGKAVLHEFYPSENLISFDTPEFSLTGDIKEEVIAELFPHSYNGMIHRLKTDKYFNERRLRVEMIPACEDSCGFIFHFEEGNLSYIELWWFIC